jgi:hypothetical protein
VVFFGDAAAYITSLGITYNLNRDTAFIFQSLCAKLKNIAVVLGGRQASMMACAIGQNVITIPQIIYPLQFYCFFEKQHDQLTSLLLKPLRVVKGVGTKLNYVVLTNPLLGGYMSDVHSKVQETKLRLFNRCMAEGGATRQNFFSASASVCARTAMKCLCLPPLLPPRQGRLFGQLPHLDSCAPA